MTPTPRAAVVRNAIRVSGLTIYDSLDERPDLMMTVADLEWLLQGTIVGLDIEGPLRTRSKKAKQAVAAALGYPIPVSFERVKPRFPGQNLDVFVQTADNLQIWNQEVQPTQRYVILRPDEEGRIAGVRVLTGDVIAALDKTGTLTSKFQAKRKNGRTGSLLVSPADTGLMAQWLGHTSQRGAGPAGGSTASPPARGAVLPIAEVFERLLSLVGTEVLDPGMLQDRLRGEALQQHVASRLEVGAYENFGQWPDIRSQAVEVKLQMSPTIDLGLVLPSSDAPAEYLGDGLRHCDVRYAVFYGSRTGDMKVRIESLVLVTGQDFFREFQQFGGLTTNRKLQIRLPRELFDT